MPTTVPLDPAPLDDELEQRKKALEAESAKQQKEIEEEAKRIRAVEEAERRAKEQRAKNPRIQVPMASGRVSSKDVRLRRRKPAKWKLHTVKLAVESRMRKQVLSKHCSRRRTVRRSCRSRWLWHLKRPLRMVKNRRSIVSSRWRSRSARNQMCLVSRRDRRSSQYLRRKPVRKKMLRSLMEESLRVPSLDRLGDRTPRSSRQKRRRARNGARKYMKMNGKLDVLSEAMRSIFPVRFTLSRRSGRRRCRKLCGSWRTEDSASTPRGNKLPRVHIRGSCEATRSSRRSDTFEKHFGGKGKGTGGGTITTASGGSKDKKAGPGPDEAGSDPSGSEETESSDESNDPVQATSDGPRDLE